MGCEVYVYVFGLGRGERIGFEVYQSCRNRRRIRKDTILFDINTKV